MHLKINISKITRKIDNLGGNTIYSNVFTVFMYEELFSHSLRKRQIPSKMGMTI